jgi:mannosyltransferase
MAITPTVVFYAQTARSYAMVYLCVAAATLVLIHALKAEAEAQAQAQGRGRGHAEEQGWGRGHAEEHGRSRFTRLWLLYIPLITLAGYLNEMALLVLTAHAVTVLLARYGRGTFVHWLIAAVIGGVLVAPLGYVSAREDGAVHWIGRPTIGAVRVLFGDYFGAKPVGGIFVFLLAVAGVLPSLTWWRHRRAARGRATTPAGSVPGDPASGTPGADGTLPWWRQGGLSLQSVALPLLVLPGGLLMLESLVGKALYVDRYVLYGEAGAAMLAGTGIYRVGRWVSVRLDRRALLGVVGVVICACALAIQVNAQHYVRTPRARMFDFGGPAQYVGAHAKPGDGVMFFNLFYRKDRLGYPDDFRNVQDFSMAVSPQVRGNFNGINKPFREVRPLMLRHERIWALGRLPTAHLTGPGVRHEAAVLIRRFTLVETVHFRGFNVSLWVRDS